MKINKEGYKIIGLTGVVCFLLWALMYYLMSRHAEAGLLWFGSILLCLLYTSPSPRDVEESRMPSSA